MRIFIASLLFLFAPAALAQSKCLPTAGEIQPRLTSESRRDFEAKLNHARSEHEKNPTGETFIWLGRRTAYLGRYKEAIEIFSTALKKFPKDARLYRHRGHRFITIRCFEDAIADFQKARKLIKGKPDEVEPDGLPNARNIPTSTLQFNIWYHLGLAYYLSGQNEKALHAYRECLKVSDSPDRLVSTTHWLYMTLRRLNQRAEAAKALEPIHERMEVIENLGYYRLVLMYKGILPIEDLLDEAKREGDSAASHSILYGVGNWHLYNGRRDQAIETLQKIVSGNQWTSFGYIAAETDLRKSR